MSTTNMYKPVPRVPDFPSMEREVLRFWEENRIFEKLRKQIANGPRWSFLDGPITANNPMGVHHAWGRFLKDMYQRYHAMNGHALRYQNGFDCQAPHKRFPYLWGGKGGVKVEYLIHAPHDSRLVIQHGAGYVLVSGMTGDVEATSHSGDILLMLPDSGTYSIDARSKLGVVSSDFAGAAHRRHLVGSGFASVTSSPSHRIYLRTLMGGITIRSEEH